MHASIASRRARLRATALALTGALVLGCAGDPPTAAPRSEAEVLVAGADLLSAWPALWDQHLAVGSHVHMGGSTAAADDFVVPAGATWTIVEIVLAGSTHVTFVNDQPVVDPVTISIVTNAGGALGTTVASWTLTPIAHERNANVCTSCAGEDHLFRLPQPLALGAGSYWIEVALPAGSFFTWLGSAQQNGASAQWSFEGAPWTSFNPPFDLAFALYGNDGSPAGQTSALQISLGGMGIESGTFTSLSAKLRNLAAAIASGDTAAACSALRDFINQVNALAGKKLTAAQATTLLNAANALRTQLGC